MSTGPSTKIKYQSIDLHDTYWYSKQSDQIQSIESLTTPLKAKVTTFNSSSSKLSSFIHSKWFNVAMIIVGLIGLGVTGIGITGYLSYQGMLPSAMTGLNAFGSLGAFKAVAVVTAGGALSIISIGSLIIKSRSKPQAYSPKNMISLGSVINPLNEDEIKTQLDNLSKLSKIADPKKGLKKLFNKVDTLVIYAKDRVAFSQDPGFVQFNPKKLILVGAEITRLPVSTLDDTLA